MMTEGQVLISDPAKVVWGHPVSQQFFVDNLRLRRARDMKKFQCVCFVNTHRLICNLGHATRRDLDLRLNFGLSMSACMFRCVLTRGTRCRSNFISIVLGSKLISEKTYGKKLHFTFHDIWRLMYWPCVISDGKNAWAFHELSFAFLYLAQLL